MGKLFFKLREVPEPEAEQVRLLLDQAGIAYYETNAGNWGISLAALWLAQESDYARAKELLEQFQKDWQQNVLHEQQLSPTETIIARLKRQPLRMFLALIAIAAILYLSIMPFTGAWS